MYIMCNTYPDADGLVEHTLEEFLQMHHEIPRIGLHVRGGLVVGLHIGVVTLPGWILDDLHGIVHRAGQHSETYPRVHPKVWNWESVQEFHRHLRFSRFPASSLWTNKFFAPVGVQIGLFRESDNGRVHTHIYTSP